MVAREKILPALSSLPNCGEHSSWSDEVTKMVCQSPASNHILSASRNFHKEELAPSACNSANNFSTRLCRCSLSHTSSSEPIAVAPKKAGVMGTDVPKTGVQKTTLSRTLAHHSDGIIKGAKTRRTPAHKGRKGRCYDRGGHRKGPRTLATSLWPSGYSESPSPRQRYLKCVLLPFLLVLLLYPATALSEHGECILVA